MPMQRLTASRLTAWRRCPRRHYYRYELGLAPLHDADALTFGRAYHYGLEHEAAPTPPPTDSPDDTAAHATRADPRRAQAVIDDAAALMPPEDLHRIQTLRALLAGHAWYYQGQPIDIHASEHAWELPLRNPQTGGTSQLWKLAGKVDALVTFAGRRMVLEYKTTSDDISPGSDYWSRLRCDPQLSQYVLAAQAQGFPTATVLYDVTRKPSIRPRQIPKTDAEGPIVLDAAGDRVYKKDGKPRASADKGKGYMTQTETETPEAFGERLLADVTTRPEWYFQRMEIPLLEDHLAEFRFELWQQAKAIREAQRAGRWYRNIDRNTCPFCPFRQPCLDGVAIDPAAPPSGFTVHADPHPELAPATS